VKFFSFLFKSFFYLTLFAALGCLYLKVRDYCDGPTPKMDALKTMIKEADQAHAPAATQYLPGSEPTEAEQKAAAQELAPITSQITAAVKTTESLQNARDTMEPSASTNTSNSSQP
jgi:hypothetical protein